MSPDERARLRELVDQRRRERLVAHAEDDPTPRCLHCGTIIPPERGLDRNGKRKAFPLYCRPLCRKYAWQKTPRGRVMVQAAERRRYLRRKGEREMATA